MTKRFRVLFAPLDWGLGHSSRCVPIIKSLLRQNIDVILGGSGNSFELLKKEFPELQCLLLESYPITYPRSGNFHWHFIKAFPKMLSFIKRENKVLSELIAVNNIDAVISDNRYGLYNENIRSVFISHQIIPRTGIFSWITKKIIKALIEKYDLLWIPDVDDDKNLAGEMSKSSHISIPVQYIGPLSRFEDKKAEKNIDVLAILSGPEPQRSYFEQKLIAELRELEGNHAVVRGIEDRKTKLNVGKNIAVFDLLPTEKLQDLISSSKTILSRSGYSSIMDYIALKRTAILVPTKNQSEQEYLAKYHQSEGYFVFQEQDKLDIKKALLLLSSREKEVPNIKSYNLDELVSDFCQSLY